MARVYVSSTVADLVLERRAVTEWLVAAGHQPVHSYLPNSDTVRDSCLEDVDGCDLYVLIMGHRYGLQPSQDNPEGLSITHLEFRRAGQSRKPRIALLRTSIPEVSLSDLADPQKIALVSAFREEVARQVRPAEFSDLHGLIQGLSTGVQAELAKRSPATGWSRALFPPPVLDVKPRGRGQVIDELAGLALAVPGHAVVLAGLGGSGKSTVARAVAARVLEQDRCAWWVPAADAVSMTQLLLGLAGELGASRGQIKDALAGRLNPSDVLWQQLETATGWLLVLDNADDPAALKAGDRPVTSGSGWLRSTAPAWCWPRAGSATCSGGGRSRGSSGWNRSARPTARRSCWIWHLAPGIALKLRVFQVSWAVCRWRCIRRARTWRPRLPPRRPSRSTGRPCRSGSGS